jgi:putative membrane protein
VAADPSSPSAIVPRFGPRHSSRRERIPLWLAVALLGLFAYEGVIRALLLGIVRLPLLPGGLTTLTTIVAACSLAHAWYSLGGRNTLAFFCLSAVIAWVYEQVGVATGLVFGAYHYTNYLGARLGDVPLLIPLAWFMMIYPSYVIANLALERCPIGTPAGMGRLIRLAAASAVVMTIWDLVIDPILSGAAVRAWIWETGGPYFGIPLQNYAGWLLTTFTVYLAYRAIEQRYAPIPLGPVTRGVAALPIAVYGVMLASDLLSGLAPAGLAVIGVVVMGVPLVVATWRLWPPAQASAGTPAPAVDGPHT